MRGTEFIDASPEEKTSIIAQIERFLYTNTKLLEIKLNFKPELTMKSFLDNFVNLERLFINNNFNEPLGDLLINLKNLKRLFFNDSFGNPNTWKKDLPRETSLLQNSLDHLAQLEVLICGDYFNQPLGNSLAQLKKLKKLIFGRNFNQPLGNSLDNLTELEELYLGDYFNQPLEISLAQLKNLKILIIGNAFTQDISGIFNLPSLNKVILSVNYILTIPDSHQGKVEYMDPLNISFKNSNDSKKYFFENTKISEIYITQPDD